MIGVCRLCIIKFYLNDVLICCINLGEVLLGGLMYFVLGYDCLFGGGKVCWELL